MLQLSIGLIGIFAFNVTSLSAYGHGGHDHGGGARVSTTPSRPSVSTPKSTLNPSNYSSGSSIGSRTPDLSLKSEAQDSSVSSSFRVILSSDIAGSTVSNPLSNTHFKPGAASQTEPLHVMNSLYLAYQTSAHSSLFVNPRLDFHPHAEVDPLTGHADSLVWENPLIGMAWDQVYQMGRFSISNVSFSIEIPANKEWVNQGLIAGPGVFIATQYPISDDSRWNLGLDGMSRLFMYKGPGDNNNPSASPDVLGYLAPSVSYQASSSIKARVAYELAGYYYRNRSDFTFASDQVDLRTGVQWTPSPAWFVTPYILFFPGERIASDKTVLGVEVSLLAI